MDLNQCSHHSKQDHRVLHHERLTHHLGSTVPSTGLLHLHFLLQILLTKTVFNKHPIAYFIVVFVFVSDRNYLGPTWFYTMCLTIVTWKDNTTLGGASPNSISETINLSCMDLTSPLIAFD